ncbi:pentapeptide repeat-containing protein [Streptomyces sp. NPDC005780]|uniref:pentapeptide repeat-containing protein n=1 Tax=Streptomyces sp. NPDC005780 TaxID=3364730 RepID=UPI0036BD817C
MDFSGTSFTHALLNRIIIAHDYRLGEAIFDGADFVDSVNFSNVTFMDRASFAHAKFREDVSFAGADFGQTRDLGPMYCRVSANFTNATFHSPVLMQIAARHVFLMGARWESTAIMRFRYAHVDLERAAPQQPIAVTAALLPFSGDPLAEKQLIFGTDPVPALPKLISISGVDASQLAITDFNLSECVFTGAFHLDQISLEGDNVFSRSPGGVHWNGFIPFRYTPRRVLAEEHYWRSDRRAVSSNAALWRSNPTDVSVANMGPQHVGADYRQLRKALEEAKNEPDAADFYYGEMEMRRIDTLRPPAERLIITAYWAVSGYGLRATRALLALIVAMFSATLLLVSFGLPMEAPLQEVRGTKAGGYVIDMPDAKLEAPFSARYTPKRVGEAMKITLNSFVFREAEQTLTPAGVYVGMASRVVGPLLIALFLLCLRGRIKR